MRQIQQSKSKLREFGSTSVSSPIDEAIRHLDGAVHCGVNEIC